MSSVLICGMELPDHDHICLVEVDSDGNVFAAYDGGRTKLEQYKAVPVPPHGRLIDADALIKQVKRDGIRSDPFVRIVCDYFKDAPTIIKAEEGEV